MANNKRQIEPLSPYISGVLQLMEDAVKDHAWNYDEVYRMDGMTQDLLHKLELDDLDYASRAKVATQLKKCRRMRRQFKDTAEVLEPLVKYLDTEKGKNFLNLLKEVLGKTRKAEERMENRAYYPRVLNTSNGTDDR